MSADVELIRAALARRGAVVLHVAASTGDDRMIVAYLHEHSGRAAAEESRRIVRSLPGVVTADFLRGPTTLLVIQLKKE